ncbi:MAG: FAD/NAD(P)-binding protein [Rhodospirillales bacterium]
MTKKSARLSADGAAASPLGRLFARFLGANERNQDRPASAGDRPVFSPAVTVAQAPPAAEDADRRGGDGSGFRIAIIGAGLSGSLLAVHLLQRCQPADRIYLIESRAGFGRGLAYSTSNPNHLLNVRAGNMSAFPDQPDHFVAWLRSRAHEMGEDPPTADCFVSRQLYGTYIRSLLADRLWGGGKGRNLVLVPDTAQAITEDGDGLRVIVDIGRSYGADAVVLAAGHFPPDRSHGAYRGNPWDPEAIAKLHADDKVALIGTGLTMVDVVQSLLDSGHRGPIVAVSRRGLLPAEHAPTVALPLAVEDLPPTTSVTRLVHWLRRRLAQAEAEGIDWRAVVDGLRPHLTDLWRRLPIEERRRFLRHLRAAWDVHRHRLAPQVAAMLRAARARGQFTVHAARVVAIHADEERVRLSLRPRGSDTVDRIEVARVINCSGPESDYRATRHPLILNLLDQQLIRPDPLRLGLDVTEDGALIAGDGTASTRLFALGPMTRGTFWEVGAVPDIRLHAARLATRIIQLRDLSGAARRHA